MNSGQNYENRNKPKRRCKVGITDPFETAFSPIDSLKRALLIGENAVSNETFSTILWTVFVSRLAEIRPKNIDIGRNLAPKNRNSVPPKFGKIMIFVTFL